jgi:hypothetical protein
LTGRPKNHRRRRGVCVQNIEMFGTADFIRWTQGGGRRRIEEVSDQSGTTAKRLRNSALGNGPPTVATPTGLCRFLRLERVVGDGTRLPLDCDVRFPKGTQPRWVEAAFKTFPRVAAKRSNPGLSAVTASRLVPTHLRRISVSLLPTTAYLVRPLIVGQHEGSRFA